MTLDELKRLIATANRILFRQGVVDAFGHVSARHPDNPAQFLLARNMAPGSVAAGDVMLFDVDSEPVDDTRRPYLERFIHGEIFRARPDVHAVVHSHSAAVIPFGIVKGANLRPVCHMSGFIGAGAAQFEIRDCGSDATDLLIRDRRLGEALARSLGQHDIVLMRGHGSTVAAPSVQLAVYRAVYAEVNARLQCQAITMGGEIEFLTEAEARSCRDSTEGQVERAWNLWASQAEG